MQITNCKQWSFVHNGNKGNKNVGKKTAQFTCFYQKNATFVSEAWFHTKTQEWIFSTFVLYPIGNVFPNEWNNCWCAYAFYSSTGLPRRWMCIIKAWKKENVKTTQRTWAHVLGWCAKMCSKGPKAHKWTTAPNLESIHSDLCLYFILFSYLFFFDIIYQLHWIATIYS